MSKWGSEIKLFGWYLVRPRNLVLMLRAFAYVLAVLIVLDFREYRGNPGYVEVDRAYLETPAIAALIAGAFGAFVYLKRDRETE